MTDITQHFDTFYQQIAGSRKIYTIQDEKGIPTPQNAEKIKAMPFWSSEQNAQNYIDNKAGYQGFNTLEIEWDVFADKWAQGLWRDGLCAGVNWLVEGEHEYDVELDELVKGVKALI
jgi:hypothetical protein